MGSSGKPFICNLAAKMDYLAYLEDEEIYVNLAGYYGYLETAYYASQDLRAEGKDIHPTCMEILDGAVVPVFLEKARLAGLKVPEHYVTNGYFEPPVIVDSINPFMTRQSIVLKNGHQERVAKSMTRNFTYAICCQEVPPESKIGNFRMVLGWTTQEKYLDLAQQVWQIFRIPVANIRIITLPDESVLVSAMRSIPFQRLTARELRYVESKVQWPI
ncbi:hypothetical protein TRIP_C20437 [Candidatus Zixiibacteriota bacterium]|nr:hypothetical protein TRIP_C20437 [candidate division Zixibacteria bacterium]